MKQGLPDILFSGIVAIRDRLLKQENPIRMESGDPDFDTPGHIKEAMARALIDQKTHYAPSTGVKELRETIIEKIQQKNNIAYISDPAKILVTNGGMHGLFVIWQTLLNPGDAVIIPQPNWTASTWNIRLTGAHTVPVTLHPELKYRWDLTELESKITNKTKAILINTPHNPTGGILTKTELTGLLKIAEKHGLFIISDEAYEDIIYGHEHISLASLANGANSALQDRIISVFTFSKSYAMTGWRLGYIVTSNSVLLENMKKMILYSINGVSTPTQYAGIAALRGPQHCIQEMQVKYLHRRDKFFEGVNQSHVLSCKNKPDGSFYLYPEITDKWKGTANEFANYLIDKYALGCVPGSVFGDDQKTLRFSFACSDDMIDRAVACLANE